MRFLSLFSGIGGIDLGLERAGMMCVAQVEIDSFCRLVLEKHWPNVKRYADVRTFNPAQIGPVDLVAGGFPCKQTSTAAAICGRRVGLSGIDSGLWGDELRIIGLSHPEWAVVENVGGVSTWADQIESDLAKIGYTVSRIFASAAGVGAPHLRRRIFFVANAHGQRLQIARETGSCQAPCGKGGAADRNAWLSSISRILRVDDGVPGGVDRRKRIVALGNAVVPQVAEWIGRRLMETQHGRETSQGIRPVRQPDEEAGEGSAVGA